VLETLGAGSFSTVIKVRPSVFSPYNITYTHCTPTTQFTHRTSTGPINRGNKNQARPKLRPELQVVLKETRGVSQSAVTRANVGREVSKVISREGG
jgi:hypothetical protein